MKYIEKIGDFEYEVRGTVKHFTNKTKTVEVDGKLYKNEEKELVESTMQDLYKDKPFFRQCFEYEFEEYNINLKVWDYTGFLMKESALDNHYSKNDYVNRILYLTNEHKKDFPFIKRIHAGKHRQLNYSEEFQLILESQQVWLTLFEYGWSNSVQYAISIKEFMQLDFEKVDFQCKEIFRIGGFPLDKLKNNKNTYKLINTIAHETSK